MNNDYQIFTVGDHAITIEFGNAINESIYSKVMALYKGLKQKPFKGLLDVIPAYVTVTVIFDLEVVLRSIQNQQTAFQWVLQKVEDVLATNHEAAELLPRQLEVPVCYNTTLAPDLAELAKIHGLGIDEVIHLHISTTYKVYMIGFLPGFPYMASVADGIATPRKSSPRKHVPAGSVGIAGQQTGIYPFASPGGWQIIGRTPLQIFDTLNETPAFFQPGDEVRFYPISLKEFKQALPA